jgi:hypothetical protein
MIPVMMGNEHAINFKNRSARLLQRPGQHVQVFSGTDQASINVKRSRFSSK